VEVVASLSQGRAAAAQCGLFTYKSVPVIFEPPCLFTARFNTNKSAFYPHGWHIYMFRITLAINTDFLL